MNLDYKNNNILKDWQKHIIIENTNIKQTLECLNTFSSKEDLTLFVVNVDNQLVGTITDGDIRRGLLNGKTLETPIIDVMFREFRFLEKGNIDIEKVQFFRQNEISLVPILNKEKRISIVKTCLYMLSNIPVAFLYFWIAMMLFDTARITFKNMTSTILNNIKIWGCSEDYISELEVGQTQTVWIKIPNECGIRIDYKYQKENVREYVVDYISRGKIINFEIGKNKKSIEIIK